MIGNNTLGYLTATGGEFLIAGDKVSGFVARADIGGVPTLSITQSGGNVILFWPSSWTGFGLEQSPLVSPATWTPSTAQINDDGFNKSVTLPANMGTEFFCLHEL